MNKFKLLLKKNLILYIVILGMPFVLFFWMIPFGSNQTLGNDYPRFTIDSQLELMFSMKSGSYPLYIPGFAGGQTASALTLGQIFHPISHLASRLPGYWNGLALEWNTFLRILSLGISHLFLFSFIQKLKLNRVIAFLITAVTVYNLKMLDLFRYGASLESWTGHLLLCASIGWYYIERESIVMKFCIIISTYLLICSGHPQMMYYGMIGAIIFTLVIPFFTYTINTNSKQSFKDILKFWGSTVFLSAIGILLSSCYILPFYFDFITTNAGRVGTNYEWANVYLDTFIGTLNNFFFPLRSDVHSVFGGSSLILIVFLIPLLKIIRISIPKVIWVIWGVLLFSFLHMQGDRLPLHYLCWNYLPMASSFRIAGRITLIMPVFIMLLLVWVIQVKEKETTIFRTKIASSPFSFLAVLSLVIMCIFWLLPSQMLLKHTGFSATSIRNIPLWVENCAYFTGMIVLLAAALYDRLLKLKPLLKITISTLLCVAVLGQISLVIYYGTWVEKKENTISYQEMAKAKQAYLAYSADLPGSGLSTQVIEKQARESFLEPFIGKIYKEYISVKDNEDAYALMAKGRTPNLVVLEGAPLTKGSRTSTSFSSKKMDSVELVYSSFNKLIFDVQSMQSGYFGLSYPFTGHWQGFVNGEQSKIYRANGYSHAVSIQPGASKIEFRYFSQAAFIGILISCTTYILVGLFWSFRLFKKDKAIFFSLLILMSGLGIFYQWYKSIYDGDNLHTRYTWNLSSLPTVPNIAYGKTTKTSSSIYPEYTYMYSSGKAVDGDYTPGSGFYTNKQNDPFWMVDLHQSQPIHSIVVYESRHDNGFNQRPLKVSFSNDAQTWNGLLLTNIIKSANNAFILNLNTPIEARYLSFSSSGTSVLSFDEVEVYTEHLQDNK